MGTSGMGPAIRKQEKGGRAGVVGGALLRLFPRGPGPGKSVGVPISPPAPTPSGAGTGLGAPSRSTTTKSSPFRGLGTPPTPLSPPSPRPQSWVPFLF